VEGPVLVEERELAAAAGPAGEPDHNGVLLVPPRLEEEVEHPAKQRRPPNAGASLSTRDAPHGGGEENEEEGHLASWVLGRR
jgi:ribosomal protein L2